MKYKLLYLSQTLRGPSCRVNGVIKVLGVWVRNYRSVFRVEFSPVEVGCPVAEGAVRQDGVVAGGEQGLIQCQSFANGLSSPLSPYPLLSLNPRAHQHKWRVTVPPCQVLSNAVLIVSVAAALKIEVVVLARQVLLSPRHVVGDEHENHTAVLRSKVLKCVLKYKLNFGIHVVTSQTIFTSKYPW